jgi:hypothetical protein
MNAQGACSAEELENVSYKDIDMVKVVPPATHAGYAVVGGSGFVGTYVFKTWYILILNLLNCVGTPSSY